jgi:hypothetical protein
MGKKACRTRFSGSPFPCIPRTENRGEHHRRRQAMCKGSHIIVVIHVTERMKNAGALQQALSEFGCYIKTRLGLHEASEDFCSANGIIILELIDNKDKVGELTAKLEALEGLTTKTVVFDHEC